MDSNRRPIRWCGVKKGDDLNLCAAVHPSTTRACSRLRRRLQRQNEFVSCTLHARGRGTSLRCRATSLGAPSAIGFTTEDRRTRARGGLGKAARRVLLRSINLRAALKHSGPRSYT